MLRFTASKLLDRSLDLLKGAFLHITTGAGSSVYLSPCKLASIPGINTHAG